MNKSADIDHYISAFPESIRNLLEQVRATIHKAAPDAEETISYAIPTFTLHGNLVHFAGYQHHIGFYPGAAGIAAFKDELSVYKGAKGSVQFPLDKPMPLALITRIVKFRVEQNLEKANQKLMRTCPKGHKYHKSSDCPTCPVCERERKPETGFVSQISAPAMRALENAGITNLNKLSRFTEKEILALHGMGPGSIPKLSKALRDVGLAFKKN